MTPPPRAVCVHLRDGSLHRPSVVCFCPLSVFDCIRARLDIASPGIIRQRTEGTPRAVTASRKEKARRLHVWALLTVKAASCHLSDSGSLHDASLKHFLSYPPLFIQCDKHLPLFLLFISTRRSSPPICEAIWSSVLSFVSVCSVFALWIHLTRLIEWTSERYKLLILMGVAGRREVHCWLRADERTFPAVCCLFFFPLRRFPLTLSKIDRSDVKC